MKPTLQTCLDLDQNQGLGLVLGFLEPLDVSVKVSLCPFPTVSLPDQSFCPAQTAQWLAEPAGQQEMRSQGSRNSPVDPD